MQIEEINAERLKEVPVRELLSMRLRFTQLWGKNFRANDKKQVGSLNRKDFIAKYRLLLSELRQRDITYRNTQMDLDILQKNLYGFNVQELPDMVVIPDFVTIVGGYVRNPKKANDLDIVFRADDRTRDESLELKVTRALGKKINKDVHYIYNSTGPHSTSIGLWDLVLVPKDTTKRTVVRESYTAKMSVTEEKSYYEGLDRWNPGFEAEYQALEKELSGSSVLDLGCGTGRVLDRLRNDYEVKGVDNNPTAIKYLDKKRILSFSHDLNKKIPFADKSYDNVICTHALEHLLFPGTTISEAKRIAKNKAIFIVPLGRREDTTHKLSISEITDLERMIPTAKCSEIPGSDNSAIAVIDLEEIKKAKLTPFGTWTPPKPTMAGFTEAFSVEQIWNWAKDRTLVAEPKLNGFRMILAKEGEQVKFFTDGKKDITSHFPEIEKVLKKIPGDFLLDTSVGIEKNGKPLPRIKLMTLMAAKPVIAEDERIIFTIFDMPYSHVGDRGMDHHTIHWSARRKILEKFYSSKLKRNPHFALTEMRFPKGRDDLEKAFKIFAQQPGSEGMMLKDIESTWDTDGSESGWAKIKTEAEIKVIVLERKKNNGTYNYAGGVTVGSSKFTNRRDFKGTEYVDLGKTFNTKLLSNVGDILTVAVQEIIPKDNKLVWLGPRVIDIDDSRDQPYAANQIIQIAKNRNILQKAAGNIDYKLGDTGVGVLQIHIMGIEDEYLEELKKISGAASRNRNSWQKLRMFLKAHIGEQGAHLDLRMVKKGDNFFEGGELLIGNLSGLDKIKKLKEGGKLRFEFKVPHAEEADVETIRGPVDWMDAGKNKLEIFTPGQAGATKLLHAAMLTLDRFTWKLTQADPHAKKLEIKGASFIPSGTYLIAYVPLKDGRKWMISKLKEQVKKFTIPDLVPIFIQKDDGEERIICGVVYEPDEIDIQEDSASEEEIRKAAYYFMENSQNFGHNHGGDTITWAFEKTAIVKVLESYLAPIDFQMECPDGHKEKVKKGSWILTSRVISDDLWARIKSGEITGYSMAGSTKAIYLDEEFS